MTRLTATLALGLGILQAIVGAHPSSADEIEPEFRAKIVQLMDATGASDLGEKMGTSMADHMVAAAQQPGSAIPPEALGIVREVTLEILVPEMATLQAKTIPLYAKYFTSEDVDALLAFYATPTGRKTVTIMPALMQESMQIGADWAKSKVPELHARLLERLQEAGYAPN